MRIWDDIDMYNEDDVPTTFPSRTCDRCGAKNLHWEDDNGRWILVHKNGEIHRCPAKEQLDVQTLIENGY